MSDAMAFFKERPEVAGALVLGVAVMAYLASRNTSAGSGSTDYAFRGNAAQSIDPNAAAIEEAAIQAGSTNLATIAGLAGLENSNSTALTGSLAQTSAARDVSLAQTGASRDVSLAGIGASLRAALFQTDAARETSLAQTQAGVTIAQDNNSTALQAASITDGYNRAQLAATQQIETLHAQNEQFAIQAGKDIARAADNASLFSSLFGGAVSLLSHIF